DQRVDKIICNADNNFIYTWRNMMATSPKGEVQIIEDLVITNCGISVPFFNTVFTSSQRMVTEQDIAIAKNYFSKINKSFQFCLHEPWSEQSSELLEQHGFILETVLPGMSFSDTHELPINNNRLTVIQPRTEKELSQYITLVSEAYDLPDWLARHILNTDFITQKNVHLYLALVDNIPASTSMLVNTPEVAGIYWVATGKSARQKGYGELVTWHAVREALQQGYSSVILQASAMGEPIYQRMGFETICRYQLWTFNVI
ncbi:MAG: GNAT family N-acetyltransferase, partial [Pseudomonadales bacterium]|nr:GNAT family N-acetyltransferase [Pseudomonadales bacterium]